MKKNVLIFLLLFFLLFVFPLWIRPLISPDEVRHAEIAREMIANSDYVSPTLNGMKYFEKPVMGYWIFACAQNLFGENAFAMRFPVALAAGCCAWIVFLLGRRYAGGSRIGLLAAGIYLTMPMVFLLASVAIPEGLFTCFLTACLALFFYASSDPGAVRWKKNLFLFCSGILSGLAFLTEGVPGFVLPVIVAVPYLIWEKRWKEIFILPWFPLLGALTAVLPWAFLIHQAEADFWRYFIVEEHLLRFFGGKGVGAIQNLLGIELIPVGNAGAMNAPHQEPFYFFFLVLLVGAGQWLLLLPVIGAGLKQIGWKGRFLRYCVCCAVLPFLFFSISAGKLPSYLLPCFAPLALLSAAGLYKSVISGHHVKYLHVLCLVLGGVLLLAGIGFSIHEFTGFPAGEVLFRRGELWKWLLMMIACVMCTLILALSCSERNSWKKILYFMLAFVPAILASYLVMPESVVERKSPSVLISSVRRDLPEDVQLAAYRHPFQAVCWEFQRDDVWIFLRPGELRYGLRYPEQSHRLLDLEAFGALVEKERGSSGVLLVLPSDLYLELYRELPEPKWVKGSENENGYKLVAY